MTVTCHHCCFKSVVVQYYMDSDRCIDSELHQKQLLFMLTMPSNILSTLGHSLSTVGEVVALHEGDMTWRVVRVSKCTREWGWRKGRASKHLDK